MFFDGAGMAPLPDGAFCNLLEIPNVGHIGAAFLERFVFFLPTHVHVKTARTGFFASMNDTDPSAANIDSTVKPSR